MSGRSGKMLPLVAFPRSLKPGRQVLPAPKPPRPHTGRSFMQPTSKDEGPPQKGEHNMQQRKNRTRPSAPNGEHFLVPTDSRPSAPNRQPLFWFPQAATPLVPTGSHCSGPHRGSLCTDTPLLRGTRRTHASCGKLAELVGTCPGTCIGTCCVFVGTRRNL